MDQKEAEKLEKSQPISSNILCKKITRSLGQSKNP